MGCTPLMFASANNHAQCVSELLDHGASFNAKNMNGAAAYSIACRRGSSDGESVSADGAAVTVSQCLQTGQQWWWVSTCRRGSSDGESVPAGGAAVMVSQCLQARQQWWWVSACRLGSSDGESVPAGGTSSQWVEGLYLYSRAYILCIPSYNLVRSFFFLCVMRPAAS